MSIYMLEIWPVFFFNLLSKFIITQKCANDNIVYNLKLERLEIDVEIDSWYSMSYMSIWF